MKSFAAIAALVATVSAAHVPMAPTTTNATYMTSTVYTTHEITITSCPPAVVSCPSKSTVVSTVTVPAYTTVCPVDEVPTSSAAAVPASSSSAMVYPTGSVPASSPSMTPSGSAAPTHVETHVPSVPVVTVAVCPKSPCPSTLSSTAAALPQTTSPGVPIVPGSSMSFSAPGSTITIAPSASVYPTGVTPSGTSSASPVFTGAAYKVGGSMVGAVAMVGAALML